MHRRQLSLSGCLKMVEIARTVVQECSGLVEEVEEEVLPHDSHLGSGTIVVEVDIVARFGLVLVEEGVDSTAETVVPRFGHSRALVEEVGSTVEKDFLVRPNLPTSFAGKGVGWRQDCRCLDDLG